MLGRRSQKYLGVCSCFVMGANRLLGASTLRCVYIAVKLSKKCQFLHLLRRTNRLNCGKIRIQIFVGMCIKAPWMDGQH